MRGIDTNNPGNLRYVGQKLKGLATPPHDKYGMCVFQTMEDGLRGLALDLLAKQVHHHLDTVRGIIDMYAPPIENNTAAYINDLCRRLSVGPDQQITLMHAPALKAFMKAIVTHENGAAAAASISDTLFDSGIARAGVPA